MGTVVSAAARERIHNMITQGEQQEVLLDGRSMQVDGYENGNFVGPTVVENVGPDNILAKEEVFGPVLSLMKVDSYDEAVDVINSSRYGNAASIFTNNGKYARDFKYRVNAGNIGGTASMPGISV